MRGTNYFNWDTSTNKLRLSGQNQPLVCFNKCVFLFAKRLNLESDVRLLFIVRGFLFGVSMCAKPKRGSLQPPKI